MRMVRSFLSNLTSLVLALVLAVIIWAAAVREANPEVTRTFELPVELIARPNGILLNEPLDRVQIRVDAPQNTPINIDDFRAFIDLNDVEIGRSEIQIGVSYPPTLTIQAADLQIFPASTIVDMDLYITRDIPVTVNMQGDVAQTHELGDVSADPATVSISGPATRINTLAEARATVFLDNTRETRQVIRPLIFYDSQDNPVNVNAGDFSIDDDQRQSTITVVVDQLAGVADVSIKVLWRGRPATGFRFLSAVPEPRSVLIQGAPEVLDTIRTIPTEEIDISGLNEATRFPVTLTLPDGVERLDSNPVVVAVDIERIMTTDVFVVTPEIVGLGENLTTTLPITQASVILFGPLEALDTLSDSDIRVDVPLFGLGEGIHEVDPVATAPPIDGIEVRSVQPGIVTLVISSTLTETITATEELTPVNGVSPDAWFQTVPAESTAGVTSNGVTSNVLVFVPQQAPALAPRRF